MFLFGFRMSVMLASQNEFGSVPSLSISWKCLRSIGVSSSLKFWWNLAVNPSGPGHFFVERLFITGLISLDALDYLGG
jgi:hypothetical protein